MQKESEAQADLAEAMPSVKEAMKDLEKIKKADIVEVKSHKNPPVGVKMVMAAMCVMNDIKPDRHNDPDRPGHKILDYWGPSIKLLGDSKFLSMLKGYDKDNIPPHIMAKIRQEYISHPDFEPSKIKASSAAAEGLCKWVIAMEKYDRLIKSVEKK